MDTRNKRRLWILGGLVVFAVGLGGLALKMDLLELMHRSLELVRAQGAWVFFTAMAVLPLFGFPLSPFTFSAGPLFAPTLGAGWVIACGVAALTINVAVSYWFGAYALRPWMERLIKWLGYSVPPLLEGKSWELTLVLRLVPGIPFFLQSYLLGLSRVKFWIYLSVSVVVPAAYLAAAVLAGDALMQGNKLKLALAGAVFGVVGVGLHVLRKRLAAKRAALTPLPAAGDNPT